MAKKSSEVHTAIDTWTNIVNLSLIIIGGVLISLAIYYILQTRYPSMVQLGYIMIIAGIITITIGLIGFTWHLKIVRRMQAEAKANLNY
jgi:putative flippase GtrA